jgi:hypothetical protein
MEDVEDKERRCGRITEGEKMRGYKEEDVKARQR